ncbi:cytochrome P450 [Solihabitans fulvus]|uniref:cytochrome P450 n=1 Tax=Solihabitans fulvus TaxID=1892852 RepID=UPI0016619F9A|nr:cytochrome P450 [Solihabitans fulvus]
MTTSIQDVPIAPRRVPVLGHTLSLGRDPLGFLQSLRSRGDVVAFYLGTRPVCQVNSPDLIRRVLVTDAHRFSRGAVFAKARQLLGDGLATADEPSHMRQRRVMQPAFHADRVAGYVEVMREEIAEVVAGWRPGRPVQVDREMARLTLMVTTKALFRAELGQAAVAEVRRSLSPVLNGITKRSMLPGELLERVPTPCNRRFEAALHRLTTVVDGVVDAYRASGADHGDLLSMLVTARDVEPDADGAAGPAAPAMSDAEVRTQVMNILMAGTETTATALSWVFHELARHPEAERRVHEEVDTVLAGRPVTTSDLARLPYVDRVLTEAIRLHTPVWLLMRRAVEEVRLGDVTIRPGTELLISLPTLHRDPDLFPDPMRFDPDRWLAPEAKDWGRARFIPFGAGGHKCIGDGFAWAELTTAVATVCARWRLVPVPGRQVREVARAFLRPNALPMIPEPRIR